MTLKERFLIVLQTGCLLMPQVTGNPSFAMEVMEIATLVEESKIEQAFQTGRTLSGIAEEFIYLMHHSRPRRMSQTDMTALFDRIHKL